MYVTFWAKLKSLSMQDSRNNLIYAYNFTKKFNLFICRVVQVV